MLRPVPKRGGGTRWLTELGHVDALAYRRAVAPLVPRIERALGPEVLANRALLDRAGWHLAPWRAARAVWESSVARGARQLGAGDAIVVADVRDCYGSIAAGVVSRLLGPAADGAVALLRRFADDGPDGLPVGPDASAILANVVLAGLDEALRAAGVRHVRWVDDVAVWGPRHRVLDGLDALHRAAARVGLELHDGKTRLLGGPEEIGTLAPCGRSSSIIAAP
ncbi:MAG TPA: RNA-directed DNA polymerase [Actinomycetota bacterium]|nr:RNA-directed DNA polymerase [Actinomycetota bacterium]